MVTRKRDSGMSIPGMLAILLMLGFFAMCIIKMSAPYFEYLSVKDIIVRIATEPETRSASTGQTRRKIEQIFHTNQIYELDPRTVRIFQKDGKQYIDARYEVRMPIIWKIDAVLRFDDLLYQVGDPRPVTDPALLKKKK